MEHELLLKSVREAADPDKVDPVTNDEVFLFVHELERFAALVCQHQKEKDAKICEELAKHNGLEDGEPCWQWMECASAIRNQEV